MSTPTRSRRRHERASQSEVSLTPDDGTPPTPDAPTPPEQADLTTATQQSAALLENAGPFWAIARSDAGEVRTLDSVADVRAALATPSGQVWVDLVSPDHDLLSELSGVFRLHPLIVEDILESNQRAKIEVYPEAIHIVMFGLTYEGEILTHEIDIVLGDRFLLTSHDQGIDPRNAPFMKRERSAQMIGGADFALWGISDWLVDGYFPVFDRLGDEIDDLEADVMRKPNNWVVERLFQVRRDLLQIRHAVNPQREVFNQLTNRDSKFIKPDRVVYFRDVYDHLIRLTDELESYRELVSTTLDIHLSQVNNNLSDIMKRLTGVTAVLATIAAISGIFGMSEAGPAFQSQEAAGFWFVAGAAILTATLVYVFFRRRGWI